MEASAGNLLAEGLLVVATNSTSSHSSKDEYNYYYDSSSSSWVFPLLLSCLAGASTCVGAAVVFCFEPSTIRRSMAFSLSLAAAVMVTISAISILPEVFAGILVVSEGIDGDETIKRTTASDHYDFVLPTIVAATATTTNAKTILRTRMLMERLLSLGLGVSAYLLLAKLLVFLPDPEHMYLLTEDNRRNTTTTTTNNNDNDNNNYDLYLFSDDGAELGGDKLEKGIERGTNTTDSEKVRRRTKRNQQTNNNNNNNAYSKGRMGRALSNETLSSSGTTSDTEDFRALLEKEQRKRSWRVALMLFASLLIHNFPEGLCVAASAKESPELGITVAIGIFIHNVPEGIAISVPCIAAKPDRPWLAFWLASFSGLAEPLGAVVALTMLGKTKLDLENVLAFVAGVMTTVAFWELYPEAWKANDEELKLQQQLLQHAQNSAKTTGRHDSRTQQHHLQLEPTSLSWTRLLPRLFLQTEYRPILWGTIVGTGLMVATELYLP